MNQRAEAHIKKAVGYLEKGEGFYRKAAEEIIAAQEADSTLTHREIGEAFGRSRPWVQKLVAWATSDSAPITPFAEPGRDSPDVRGAKRILADAPMEQVERIIEKLPAERQRKIGAAAKEKYLEKVNKVADATTGEDFKRATDLGLRPSLYDEKRALIKKLAEIKTWLDLHGAEIVPDPDGGSSETQIEIALDSLGADKGEIDHAFSEVGVGTSIEKGFDSLLSGEGGR